jgi:alkyl hydroperoxide reductase subunit AhpC
MPSYNEDLSEFERRNTQVLGISTDIVHSQEAWAKSMGGL